MMKIQDLEHYGMFARQRKHKPWWLLKRVVFALAAMLFLCPIVLRTGGTPVKRLPTYEYTGAGAIAQLVDDSNGSYRLRLLSSGAFKFTDRDRVVDIFVVGGGASGGRGGNTNYGSGGGAGYTFTTHSVTLLKNVAYTVVIGAGGSNLVVVGAGARGGTSSIANGATIIAQAEGGYGGVSNGTPTYPASAGGSGGASHNTTPYGTPGGSNGSTPTNGGPGQGATTREFHEETGDLYSGGGGGCHNTESRSYGGAGGGGNGAVINPSIDCTAGTPNTGSGGGANGANRLGGSTAGGSGILILRDHR